MHPFKQCPSCGERWETQDAFLKDLTLSLNGYKADFEELQYGMFFFTHQKPDCQSTMVIEVSEFMNLYTGEIYGERMTGEEDCPGYCVDTGQLSRCDALCECAFVREIIHIIKQRQTGKTE